MQELIEKNNIKNMIYNIIGKQVMLDSDVAYLFGYETKDLNRNVKNNIEMFPKEYCFRLTKEEYEFLRYKNFTSKKKLEEEDNTCHLLLLNMTLPCLQDLLKALLQ